MKKIVLCILAIVGFVSVQAQNQKTYWVIETNVTQRDYTILRVYDQKDMLIHEEKIQGKAMNIAVRKDRKRINKKVKEVLNQEMLASGRILK